MRIRNVDIQYSAFHNGQAAFWFNVEKGYWEPETFDILDRYIVSGKTFIDVGAWNGVLSLYASKLGAKVESVECDPVALEMLMDNYKLNGGDIFVNTCAISDKDGHAVLESHNGDWGNSMSTIIDRHEQMGRKTVTTMTLASLVELRKIEMDNVCLIKIDTEGGECLIIPSSKDFLTKYRPLVLLSLHSFWFPDFEKNCADIADTIFPIYDVIPIYAYKDIVTIKQHTVETFMEEMRIKRCNDVLLVPKNS